MLEESGPGPAMALEKSTSTGAPTPRIQTWPKFGKVCARNNTSDDAADPDCDGDAQHVDAATGAILRFVREELMGSMQKLFKQELRALEQRLLRSFAGLAAFSLEEVDGEIPENISENADPLPSTCSASAMMEFRASWDQHRRPSCEPTPGFLGVPSPGGSSPKNGNSRAATIDGAPMLSPTYTRTTSEPVRRAEKFNELAFEKGDKAVAIHTMRVPRNKLHSKDHTVALSSILKGLVSGKDHRHLGGVRKLEDARADAVLEGVRLTPTPTLQTVPDSLMPMGTASDLGTPENLSRPPTLTNGSARQSILNLAGLTPVGPQTATFGLTGVPVRVDETIAEAQSARSPVEEEGISFALSLGGDEPGSQPNTPRRLEESLRELHQQQHHQCQQQQQRRQQQQQQQQRAPKPLPVELSPVSADNAYSLDVSPRTRSLHAESRPKDQLPLPCANHAEMEVMAGTESTPQERNNAARKIFCKPGVEDQGPYSSDGKDNQIATLGDTSPGVKMPRSLSGMDRSRRRTMSTSSGRVSPFAKADRCEEGGTHSGSFKSSLLAATRSFVPMLVEDVQTLRLAREDELTAVITESQDVAHVSCTAWDKSGNSPLATSGHRWSAQRVGSPLWLRLCGVLNFGCGRKVGRMYRCFILMLATLSVVVSTERIVHTHLLGDQIRFQLFCDLSMSLGSLIGLFAIRTLSDNSILGCVDAMLVTYARRQDIVDTWALVSAQHNIMLAVIWVGSFCIRGFAWALSEDPFMWREVVSVATHTLSSGLFVALVYGVLHVCSALAMMVDAYCFLIVAEENLQCSVKEWNTLQAVLRKGSGAVERCFLVLQTTALAYVLLTMAGFLVHGVPMWWLASVALLVLSDARLFYAAAQVTETCSRVPPLINSMSFSGTEIDTGRHYLVEYVTYSAAGFYVGEVRLTAQMALKLSYISGIVAFGILTKLTAGL